MKVIELIKILKTMPENEEVGYAWDGEVRSSVIYVWLSRKEGVVLSDGNVIYSTTGRPKEAPTESKSRYWEPCDTYGPKS